MTHDTPASKTSTEKFGFSVNLLATTFPAVPPSLCLITRILAYGFIQTHLQRSQSHIQGWEDQRHPRRSLQSNLQEGKLESAGTGRETSSARSSLLSKEAKPLPRIYSCENSSTDDNGWLGILQLGTFLVQFVILSLRNE